jgi:acyl dehydratase
MPPRIVESLQALKDLVGQEIGVTEWFVVSQERIQRFAEATEDRQWIHLDRERAERESPFHTTIAHGFLTLSLLSHFMKQAFEIRGVRMAVNYGLNRVRFTGAVPASSRIRARVTLESVKDVSKAVDTVFTFTIECDAGKNPSCIAEWIVRFYPE